MNNGKFLPDFILLINSVPSSRTVKSAANAISIISSKPATSNDLYILPSTFSPILLPNSSPNATLTEGAGPTTTIFDLSRNPSITSSIADFSLIAPTGHD